MTLPNPVTNSNQLSTEYGVANTASCPNAYYGKPGIPASGPVSTLDFAGKSNVTFTPAGGTVSDDKVAPTNPSVTLSCNQSAVWTFSLPSGVTASIGSGASATSVNFSRSLNGTSSFAVSGSAAGVTANYTVSLTKEAGGGA